MMIKEENISEQNSGRFRRFMRHIGTGLMATFALNMGFVVMYLMLKGIAHG